jgi:hypothetical protein
MVRVEAIDAHFLRARQHGARIIRDLEDFPYGERQYICPIRQSLAHLDLTNIPMMTEA